MVKRLPHLHKIMGALREFLPHWTGIHQLLLLPAAFKILLTIRASAGIGYLKECSAASQAFVSCCLIKETLSAGHFADLTYGDLCNRHYQIIH
ncbi:MAG: hypothetical protein ACAF41_34475 (plasmid) [Leptolyngbya sp. BL-A-14]